MINQNPLKQYFRRPSVYVKLPSNGKYYEPGVIDIPESGEIPVYPMTAIDDITLRTPDALFNGTAIADLIKSCVPNIKDPWSINNIDLDAILIAIRSASGDSNLEIETQCPACNEEAMYGVDLINILSQLKSANYDSEMIINELKVKFRPLNYKEMNQASLGQFEAQKMFLIIEQIQDENEKKEKLKDAFKQVTDLTMKILSEAIEYISIPTMQVDNKEYIYDFLQNCDKNVYASIRDFLANLKSATEIKPLKIKCIHCNHQYEQPFTLNAADFFG